MRRIWVGMATVVVALGVAAPSAHAADGGTVSSTAYSIGGGTCGSGGPFEMRAEFTGTLTGAGRTYVGKFVTFVSGTYHNGSCLPHAASNNLEATLSTAGPVSGKGLTGTVAGTCGGSANDTFEASSVLGAFDPGLGQRNLGVLHLGCQVSINGSAPASVHLDAQLVGAMVYPNLQSSYGNLQQLGTYSTA